MEIETINELKHIEKVLKNLITNLRNKEDNTFNHEAKSKLIKAYAEIISAIIQYEDEKRFIYLKKMGDGNGN